MHFSIINQVSVSTLDLPGFMGWDKFLNLENFLTLNHFQIWTAALGPTTKNSPSQETTLEKSNSTHIQWLNQRWGFFWEIYNKRNYLHTFYQWKADFKLDGCWAFDRKHDKVPICCMKMRRFYQDSFSECHTVFRACIMRLVATVPKWPGWNFWLTTTDCCQRADETRPLCSGKWLIKQLSQNTKSTSN